MSAPPSSVLSLKDRVTGLVYPCPAGQTLTVGRASPEAPPHIPCNDPTVSRTHCEVVAQEDFLRVVDRSTHGTFVNGVRVQGAAAARSGDELRVGAGYTFAVLPAAAAAQAPADGQPPERIGGRYRVVRELARGGMGTVYEGLDERAGARCAIKVLRGSRATPDMLKRFQREVHLGKELGDHPGVVSVLDSGALPSGELYCVMELVDGQPLDQRIRAGLQQHQAVGLVLHVARTVAYAHERGVIHRDLKPQNVLVTTQGQVRLTDFGVAKALDDLNGLTATGAVMGTLSFMSPEQATDSKRVDVRSDVYGLGAILYMALTRRPPVDVQGLGLRESLKLVVEGRIPPPSALAPGLDPSLDAICRRALARDPADRQPGAAALADELQAWLRGERDALPPPPPSGPSPVDDDEDAPGRALLVVLLIGGLVVAGIVAALMFL